MKISTSNFTLGLIAAAVVSLAACGGGGSNTAATNPLPAIAKTSQTVTVMDGLIENALVCLDSNANGICDPTEIQGRTDANGKVTLEIPSADLANAKLVAQITAGVSTDKDTGAIATSYTLQTPVGKLDVISPLTNMVQTKIDADRVVGTAIRIEDADKYVMGQLGLNPAAVSAFDNFVARKAQGSIEHGKAGERARILVVSAQASTTALAHTRSNTGSVDVHTLEIQVENDLLAKLSKVGHAADAIESHSCASNSSNVARDCETEIENEVHNNHLDSVETGTTGTGTTGTGTTGTGTTGTGTTTPVASASAGKTLYAASGCGGCHGAVPSTMNVLKGANSPSTISNAISSVGGMSSFIGKFTAQNLADLAAYLATPGI